MKTEGVGLDRSREDVGCGVLYTNDNMITAERTGGESERITSQRRNMNDDARRRVLLSSSAPFSNAAIASYFPNSLVDVRVITSTDCGYIQGFEKNICYEDAHLARISDKACCSRRKLDSAAAELIDWADMLVLAPIDAGNMGAMVAGLTTNLTLTILRGWDVAKPILLVPKMSMSEWKAPITRRQLDEIQHFWPWVKVLPPLLSRFEFPHKLVEMPWDGWDVLHDEAEKGLNLSLARDVSSRNSVSGCETDATPETPLSDQGSVTDSGLLASIPLNINDIGQNRDKPLNPKGTILPPEILSMIFETLGDWEMATAVGVYARIPMPEQWKRYAPAEPSAGPESFSLEYTLLGGSLDEIEKKLFTIPPWSRLSNMAAHLIFKFTRLDILNYLCKARMDLFWNTPRLGSLPLRASSVYGNTTLLSWWRDCPIIKTKDYSPDAMDSASRANFVHVLEWWRRSGLPLRYTERALESASAEGHIAVLDWWKRVSETSPPSNPVPLKIGKSILLAAQSGRTASLDWWDKSGIPYSHSESVARIASSQGHVPVLDLWFRLKSNKLIFDNQVLVGATKNGHVDVLEWWKRSGLRVEFRTCDIEEALEDAVSGAEERVRQWWERNGLNLGVGTSEWMKVKVL
ncbi:hypothetical protein AJ80_07240 [Polytolypa hystricis UAMH7299]|uniref:Flavoprotein domain-containing protein n=1 Tax=Polytolypa hystricis (strain UAMH7299) TaxID=1447883 RepID=A0A2B7XRA2_POLH7|nr:hypothetical protein AJ80_07240 [Polytolypa hystricis UAMH7299]